MSQDGVVLGMDAKFLRDLEKLDKLLAKIGTTASSTTTQFQGLINGGLRPFIEALSQISSLSGKGSSKMDLGMSKTASTATQAADEVNKVTQAINAKNKATKDAAASTTVSSQTEDREIRAIIAQYDKLSKLSRELEETKTRAKGVRELLSDSTDKDEVKLRREAGGVSRSAASELKRVRQEMKQIETQYASEVADTKAKWRRRDFMQETKEYKAMLNTKKVMLEEQAKTEQAIIRQTEQEKRIHIRQTVQMSRIHSSEQVGFARESAKNRVANFAAGLAPDTNYNKAMAMSEQTVAARIKKIERLRSVISELSKDESRYATQITEAKNKMRELAAENDRVRRSLDDLKNRGGFLGRMFSGLKSMIAAAFSVHVIKNFVNQLVKARGELELQNRSLQVLLQNKEEANALWDKTLALAIKSPYTVTQLVTYTKQLAAYRVESGKLYDTTKMLADISAGLGVDMQRLILAYGQVKAANYLRGTELRQFSEAGINILGELATYFSEIEGRAVTVGQVFERVSKRMVSFADVDEVLKRVTSEGGIFYNMQEKQAETLKGMQNNLKDSITIMFNEIGESNDFILKSTFKFAKYFIDNWNIIRDIINGAILSSILFGLRWAYNKIVMSSFALTVARATKNMGAMKTVAVASNLAFRNLTKTLKALWLAFASNPIGILLTVVPSVIFLIADLAHRSQELQKEYDKETDKMTMKRVEVVNYTNALKSLAEEENELLSRNKELNKESQEYKDNEERLTKIEKERTRVKSELMALDSAHLKSIEKEIKSTEALAAAAERYNDALSAQLGIRTIGRDAPEIAEKWGKRYEKEKRVEGRVETLRLSLPQTVEDLLKTDILTEEERAALERFSNSSKSFKERALELREALQGSLLASHADDALFDDFYELEKYVKRMEKRVEQENAFLDVLDKQKEFFDETEYGASLNQILTDPSASETAKQEARNNIIDFFSSTIDKVAPELKRISEKHLGEVFGFDWIKQDTVSLEDWANAYNKLLDELTSEQKVPGITYIRSDQTSRADQLKQIEDFITSQKTIIDAYGVEGQGVYTEEDKLLAEYAKSVAEKLRTFLGGDDKKDTSSGKSKTDEWTNMIRVIKEVHNAYNDLSKTFEKTTAREGTMVKYTDALNEALARVKVNGQTLSAEAFMNMFDLTTEEGMKNALKWIEKDAPEAADRLKAKLERGDITWEANIEVKNGDDERLNQSVEDLFSGYELSVELEKLNIPREFAQGLFDIKAFSLDEVRANLESMQHLFTGEEQVKKFEEFQRKLAEMETKEQRERLKTYLEYARDAVGERAKIKLDEMKKLNEIELAFAVKEGDSATERDFKNTARAKAIEKVGEDSVKAMRKLEWEEFQKSDSFVSLFADLDIASEKLLNHTISKLQDFREEWKDMPLEDVRTIVSKMGELESQLAKSDPFNMGKALRKELRGAPSIHELQEDNWTQEEKIRAIDRELEISEQVLQLRLEGKAVEADTLAYDSQREELLYLSAEETKKIVDNQKDAKQTAQDQVTTNNRLLGKYKASKEALLAQSEAIQSAQKMANDLYDAFKELSEVLGEDDSPAAVFAEMGMSMANSVLNCLALQAQLEAAKEGATKFGAAMNTAMGIIGWIVMAVQLIATVLKTAFAMHDNNLEKQIERLQERVEILQKQFEKLSDAIDNAFSNKQLAAYSEDARKNMEAQLHAYEQMIAMEEAKKKTDHDKIKGWREDMEELREDFEDMLEEAFSTATSGIVDDVLSATREFVDAWHDAFLETGDGMKGLKDNFREMLTEILRQQASLQLINPFVNMYKDWLKEYVDIESGDATLSIGEAREWAEKVQATFPEINNLLQNFFSGAEDLLREEGELSELSKGIQGVTETTAQVLEALLNSMRFYVADTNMRVQNIESVLASNDVSRNPILNELQQQTAMVRSIESMFNSVIGRGSSAHSGAYLKVLM